jgi:hypothetical protein
VKLSIEAMKLTSRTVRLSIEVVKLTTQGRKLAIRGMKPLALVMMLLTRRHGAA